MTERQGLIVNGLWAVRNFLAFIQKVMGTMKIADPIQDTPQICSSRISMIHSVLKDLVPHRLVHLFSLWSCRRSFSSVQGKGLENQSSFRVIIALFFFLDITNYMNNKYVFRACQSLLAWNTMVQGRGFLVKLPGLSPSGCPDWSSLQQGSCSRRF